MAEIQKVKIAFNSSEVFFVDHGYHSAHAQAREFIERNKNKFDMAVYHRSDLSHGDLWILKYTFKVDKG